MLGDWLVVNQILPVNPPAAVRGPKHVVTKGATPVLSPSEARKLLETIDTDTLAGLRDRALLSVMLYSFARVSAVLGMRRQDYFGQGSRGWFRLHEKGGKRHDVPAHHRAAAALDAYVEAGGLEEPKAALFQSMDPSGRRLTGRALERRVVLAMIKRRAAGAGLPPSTCCHTFRATGITAYLSNGGTLEHAQQIAGHASPKTTKLYDRTADTVTVDERRRTHVARLRPPLEDRRFPVAGPAARRPDGRPVSTARSTSTTTSPPASATTGRGLDAEGRRARGCSGKLARLGRNLAHLVNIVQDLSARGVGLRGAGRVRGGADPDGLLGVEVNRGDGLALFVPGGLDGGGERADIQPQGLAGDECRMVVSGHGGVREAARRRRSVRWGAREARRRCRRRGWSRGGSRSSPGWR